MTDMKHLKPAKLLWVDLEMTGLDPEQHVILEVAAKITDFDFTVLEEYHAIIHQSEEALNNASEWCKVSCGGPGGLFEAVRDHGRPETEVVQEFAQLITNHFGGEPAVLAGNSIHQDRRFIRKWWPDMEKLLHYRMLDVSGWKIVMLGKYDVTFEKRENHRADDDIQESIDELKFYLDWFQSSVKR